MATTPRQTNKQATSTKQVKVSNSTTNIIATQHGSKLFFEIDLDVETVESQSGKSQIIAKTGAYPIKLEDGTRIAINVYKPI